MTVVVVAGAVANKPGNGGEAWVRMNWVDGLRGLGVDTWFVEEFSPTVWGPTSADAIAWFRAVVGRFNLGGRALLLDSDSGDVIVGSGELPGDGDLLVNISGHARTAVVLSSCRRRAYVDVDPGYTQIWAADGVDLGLGDHDIFFTVGLNVGRPGCTVPEGTARWLPVLPPVVLAAWPVQVAGTPERFTTVASWRGGFGTIEHDGKIHGHKAHQFRSFVGLPDHVDVTLEVALDIHGDDDADRRRLLEHGWILVDPKSVCGDPDRFRSYVQGSDGEFSVAQSVYVGARTGWFSDRTACYLASGRPVLVQDTGFGVVFGIGDGLVTFTSFADAVARFADIKLRYGEHCVAARSFAELHLDSAVVLARVLEQAGVR